MKKIVGLILILLGLHHLLIAQKTATLIYIDQYKDIAIAEMNRTGIPASITLAQGIVESNSGESDLAKNANNHFGIKCKLDWKGETTFQDDDSKQECFRVYPTALASFIDHSNFIKTRPNYAPLFKLDPVDDSAWAFGLKKAGYATASDYPKKLLKVIDDFELSQFNFPELNEEQDTLDVKKNKQVSTLKIENANSYRVDSTDKNKKITTLPNNYKNNLPNKDSTLALAPLSSSTLSAPLSSSLSSYSNLITQSNLSITVQKSSDSSSNNTSNVLSKSIISDSTNIVNNPSNYNTSNVLIKSIISDSTNIVNNPSNKITVKKITTPDQLSADTLSQKLLNKATKQNEIDITPTQNIDSELISTKVSWNKPQQSNSATMTATTGSPEQKLKPNFPTSIFKINQIPVLWAKAGTSFLQIALENKVPLYKLYLFNDLPQTDLVLKDQLIFLATKKKQGINSMHTVIEGENWLDISQLEGIQLNALKSYNSTYTETLPAGTLLLLVKPLDQKSKLNFKK